MRFKQDLGATKMAAAALYLCLIIWVAAITSVQSSDGLLESVSKYFKDASAIDLPGNRQKREVDPSSEGQGLPDPKTVATTRFDLKHVKGDANAVRPGDEINYQLEILLPRKATTSLHIEIFTKDFDFGRAPTFGLVDVQFLSVSPGVEVLSVGNPVAMFLNKEVNTLVSKMEV